MYRTKSTSPVDVTISIRGEPGVTPGLVGSVMAISVIVVLTSRAIGVNAGLRSRTRTPGQRRAVGRRELRRRIERVLLYHSQASRAMFASSSLSSSSLMSSGTTLYAPAWSKPTTVPFLRSTRR